MAFSVGAIVANIYYIQPLLSAIASSFHISVPRVGTIAMLTQLGAAMGMLCFVPLGDTKERQAPDRRVDRGGSRVPGHDGDGAECGVAVTGELWDWADRFDGSRDCAVRGAIRFSVHGVALPWAQCCQGYSLGSCWRGRSVDCWPSGWAGAPFTGWPPA